jgi:hypothetical protein
MRTVRSHIDDTVQAKLSPHCITGGKMGREGVSRQRPDYASMWPEERELRASLRLEDVSLYDQAMCLAANCSHVPLPASATLIFSLVAYFTQLAPLLRHFKHFKSGCTARRAYALRAVSYCPYLRYNVKGMTC